jgi:hypothetical protein
VGSEAAAAPPYKDFGRILILRVEAVWKGEKGGRVGVLIDNGLLMIDVEGDSFMDTEAGLGPKNVASGEFFIIREYDYSSYL